MQNLQSDTETFRFLIENASDLITVIDESARVHYVSPSVAHILGYAPEEQLGRSILAVVHADDRETVYRMIQHGFTMDSTQQRATVRHRHKDGTWRFLESIGSSYVLPNVGRVGIISSRDVTAQREVEAKSTELDESLRRVNRMQAVSTLAGGLAHDFNNILQVIRCSLETAKAELSVEHAAHVDLAQISAAVDRARDLVHQIMVVGGGAEGRPTWVDVGDQIRKLTASLSSTQPEHIHTKLTVLPELPMIWADPIHVDQVIQNLWSNAVEAMDGTGSVRITVSSSTDSAPDTSSDSGPRFPLHLRIVVEDDGPGIDASTLEQIFNPFFSTRRLQGGTGLGLALVHGVVTLMNGDIRATSELSAGTKFVVQIPATPPSLAHGAHNPDTLAVHGKERILVVDNDFEDGTAVCTILSNLGYRASAVNSYREARALLSDAGIPLDVLVTDYRLNGSTGLDLAREARRLRPDLPVILTSVSDESQAQIRIESDGVAILHVKPLSTLELASSIRRALDEGRDHVH